MYQWNAPSVIHAASISPGTSLSISQLIRIERHRGRSYAALRGPHHEQTSPVLDHGLNCPSRRPFLPDDDDLASYGIPASNVTLQANGSTVQPPVCGSSSGLLHTASSSRIAHFRHSRVKADLSFGKIYHRQTAQSASPLPPTLKASSKKSLYTQTGPSPSRVPHLVPNKLSAGFKIPVKSKKRGDDAFREMDHGETARAWPMSGEERKAEAKRKDQARLTQEAEERQARERETQLRAAQEAAVRRREQEQLQIVERAKALALQQRNNEQKEKWMARVSASAPRLNSLTLQLDNIRSHIEMLLEGRRRKLWEQKAKMFEMTFDGASRRREHNRRLVALYSESSTVLSEAIADFCEAVCRNVHGERYRRLVPAFKFLLPRHMFAQRDTPKRIAQLCAIFWIQVHLRSSRDETQHEAHLWRHLYAARIVHELHPEAFSFRIRFAHWYCRVQRFINGADAFSREYSFWDDHTELLSPSKRGMTENFSSNVEARKSRRQHLVALQKETAKDIKRDLSQMLDRGNFVSGQRTDDFKRQQQVTLRKPFTLVLQSIREVDHEATRLDWGYVSEEHPSMGKVKQFKGRLEEVLYKVLDTARSYLAELDTLTYWNWLATERDIPQRRMSYRELSKPIDFEAGVAKKESGFVFKQDIRPDQTWRYTNFRGPDGRQVVVDYCLTPKFAERTARLFMNSKVIGIDLWGGRRFASVEDAVREGNSAKRCVPMVAIANEERIALFHFAAMTFNYFTLNLPTLTRVLEDPAICKVGENVHALRQRLLMHVGVSMEGAVNLNSMYRQTSRSPTNDNSLDYAPALARPQTSTDIYPFEPRTTTRISDQLRKYAGQSLRDDAINPEDLQGDRISSPKLLQLSASRPYAALHLHRLLAQRTQVGGKKSSLLFARSRIVKKKKVESTLFGDPSRIADHDLGPTNIDPWSEFRDYQLRDLAIALAKAIRGNIRGMTPDSHLAAYVLFTRFRQSCDDILRILRVEEPADAILNLIDTTGLPLNEEMLTRLKTWEGFKPEEQATKWIKETIASAPVLLRMHRRSDQVRTELKAYAMWHRLEMKVGEIADYLSMPWKKISSQDVFRLIRKTLKYGNPPFFPFQRARYLELLWKYAPEDYSKELDRTSEETSTPSAWGATMDTLSMSGLDLFDEEEFEIEAKTPQAAKTLTKARAFKTVKVRKSHRMAKSPKAVATDKRFNKAKASLKTMKAIRKIRIQALLPGETMYRYTRSERRASSSEQVSITQRVLLKASKASTAGSEKRSPRLASPEKGVSPKEKTSSEKRTASSKEKKSDSGDSDWLQGTTIWIPTESPALDEDTAGKRSPCEQPKRFESSRRWLRRAPKAPSAKLSGKTATGSSKTMQVSSNVYGKSHAKQSIERSEGILQDADPSFKNVGLRKYAMESRNAGHVTQTETPEGQLADPKWRFSVQKAPNSGQEFRIRMVYPSQEQKPPKGAMDLSVAIDGESAARSDSGS